MGRIVGKRKRSCAMATYLDEQEQPILFVGPKIDPRDSHIVMKLNRQHERLLRRLMIENEAGKL